MIRLLKLFQINFYTGVLFTVVSFVLGQLFDFLNIDIDLDMDGDLFGVSVAPMKPTILVSFITTFGGVGIILLSKNFNPIVSLSIALAFGAVISASLQKFIITPLYKAQNTSAVSQQDLIGHIARTKINIIGNSFGSITYVVNGNTYSSPAKSMDSTDISKGEDVKIVQIENNIFYVIRL